MNSAKFKMLIKKVGRTYPLLNMICRRIEEKPFMNLEQFDLFEKKISFKFCKKYQNESTIQINGNYYTNYLEGSNICFYIKGNKKTIILIIWDYVLTNIDKTTCYDFDDYINNILRKDKIEILLNG